MKRRWKEQRPVGENMMFREQKCGKKLVHSYLHVSATNVFQFGKDFEHLLILSC